MVTPIFFDCEFTGLSSFASLISAGFITQSGDSFYVELSDYSEDSCNDFVKATVLPLLSLPKISTSDFYVLLTDWLSSQGSDFLFIADSDWDQKMLTTTLASLGRAIPSTWHFQKTPDNFTSGMQRRLFDDEMAAFFLRHPDLNLTMHWLMGVSRERRIASRFLYLMLSVEIDRLQPSREGVHSLGAYNVSRQTPGSAHPSICSRNVVLS